MNYDQLLNRVAERYRTQGYEVVVRPEPDNLPDFAKDFKVEIAAQRKDGCVLVSVKKNLSDLEADRELPRYAETIEKQLGWRFDLTMLGPEIEPIPARLDLKEPSETEIRSALEDVERMLQAGFVPQALIAAWAFLETAMRKRLQAIGEEAGWGSSSRTLLNELYSGGVLPNGVFRELVRLFQIRTAIVHGFTTPAIENSSVEFLVENVRSLLDESLGVKKSA